MRMKFLMVVWMMMRWKNIALFVMILVLWMLRCC